MTYDDVRKKSGKKLFFGIAVLVAVTLLTFYLIFNKFKISRVIDEISSANGGYLFFAFTMVIVYLCIQGVIFKYILYSFQQEIGFFKAFTYACIDFYVSAITPSAGGGQPAVIYYMRRDSIPMYKSSITVLLNTVTYKVALLFYGAFALFFFFGDLHFDNAIPIVCICIGVTVNVLLVGICLLAMKKKAIASNIGSFFINLAAKLHLVKNAELKLNALNDSLNSYSAAADYLQNNPLKVLKVIFFSILQRGALFSVAFFVYRSLGQTELSFIKIIAFQALISLAVDTLPLPGGVGVTEAAFLALYNNIYHGDSIILASALLLTRIITYYYAMILTGIFSLINHTRCLRRLY